MTANKASRVRKLHIAFVVTPDLLSRLAVILKEVSEDLEFTVKFADGTSVQYSLDDIIQQPNAGNRAIVSLVATTPAEGVPSANVVLKAKGEVEEPTVEYTLNGPQHTVVYISDQLDNWIAATRQWYSRALAPGAGIAIVFVAALLPLYLWGRMSHFFFPSGSASWVQGVAILLMWVLEYLILRLFPRGTFAIGKGATRYQLVRSVRWGVLIALLVSFVGSVFANLLTPKR